MDGWMDRDESLSDPTTNHESVRVYESERAMEEAEQGRLLWLIYPTPHSPNLRPDPSSNENCPQ